MSTAGLSPVLVYLSQKQTWRCVKKIGEAENRETQTNYKSDVFIMTEHMCLESGLLSAWLIMHSGPA